eukprot:scaffold112962_cov60-Attheya_sp.AAC.2
MPLFPLLFSAAFRLAAPCHAVKRLRWTPFSPWWRGRPLNHFGGPGDETFQNPTIIHPYCLLVLGMILEIFLVRFQFITAIGCCDAYNDWLPVFVVVISSLFPRVGKRRIGALLESVELGIV